MEYERDESIDYIMGIGTISHISDTPRRKKKNPIGFSQPKDNGGSRKEKSLGSKKDGSS